METLIRQIAQIYENKEACNETDAVFKAVKDLLFFSLSRWDFFKGNLYIRDLDRIINQNCHLCFLKTGNGAEEDPAQFRKHVADDLKAYGIDARVQETKNGFQVVFPDGSGKEIPTFYIYSFDNKTDKADIRFFYVQTPLPFEMRCIELTDPSEHDAVQKMFENEIKSIKKQQVKKGAKKERKPEEETKKESEQWVQPSLFDF